MNWNLQALNNLSSPQMTTCMSPAIAREQRKLATPFFTSYSYGMYVGSVYKESYVF